MAVSCSEVMYGAYYPYLYGRGAARSFHHAPHFQYDRFNVQSGAGGASGASGAGGGAGGGEGYASGAALSSGSTSSGAGSPPHAHTHTLTHTHAHAPPHSHAHSHLAQLTHHHRLRAKEEDAHGRASADGGGSSESDGECGGAGGGAGGSGGGACRARAQYVSANCVVFTHYSGDVASVVDEHFARALALDKHKESVPMASRNLPPSFFNAAVAAGVAPGPPCAGVDLYEYDAWHQHYSGYGHAAQAAQAAQYHSMAAAAQAHHSMAAAAGYSGLLLGRGSIHHQYKPVPVEWSAQHHAPHHLDPAYTYPPVPAGLEAQVQDTSKDLYWF